jgi:hypothetical protein
MKLQWSQTILRAASLLAPSAHRDAWMEEWRTELWYVPPDAAARFCLGAFSDAFWLRRNQTGAARPNRNYLESPVRCLALLAAGAIASIFFALRLAQMLPFPQDQRGADKVGAFVSMLFLYLLPAAISLVVGGSRPTPSARRLRGGIFLALKIIFVLPILQCTTLFVIICAPFASLGIILLNIALFRWIFLDQRRRCPVCLRLLTQPVRIGNPSQTFLEWYGAESVCSRGHGLLHDPDLVATYAAKAQWLKLDRSWSGLFSGVSMR